MLLRAFTAFFTSSAFAGLTSGNLFMIGLGSVLLYVAVAKNAEPLLLIPIGFGMILANIPPLYTGLFMEPTTTAAGGLMYYINLGLQLGIYPPLIFLGIGALTDFSFMLSNPITIFLGGAAQVGIFIAFFLARQFGFDFEPSAAISIIGGADGPTSIYIANKFAPDMLAIIAIAAYSYIALIPIIQPPLMRLFTTKEERLIRMKPPRKVKKVEKLVFSIITTVFIGLLVPQALPLIGMLMLGNFLKENGLTKRLAEACAKYIADPAIIMLCLSVGASAKADIFLSETSLLILFLGAFAFVISTISGLLFAKIMNLFLKEKINPLIGGSGVSAVPDSARVAQMVAQKEDPSNFILMHAMGPNVAGVIGSAVAAGVFLSILGG
ncbi:MAG: sodium ion-translocating decarboxylase subunit beta [Thermotogota bacterium]|nr:sodium ion-translocating decarboxylase subunit beta [Thermotogota bacterium]